MSSSCRLGAWVLGALVAGVVGLAAGPERWEGEITAFEAEDARRPPRPGGLLFTGSSSIRLWSTLVEDFPGRHVVNRGFGGSGLEDAIAFLDRTIVPHRPRKIFLYAGANDIAAGGGPARVLADFQLFVGRVRERLPGVEIAFLSIAGNPARWAQVERMREANRLVADFAAETPGVEFIDVFSAMLGPDGRPREELFVEDRLHMNERGYRIWREVVGRHLPPPEGGAATGGG